MMPAVDAATVAEPSAPLRATRAAAVGAVLALIVLGLAWELWLAPTGARTLALKVLPLAWPFGGLLRLRMQSYRVLSLLVWLYVAEGLVRATSSSGLVVPLAWSEVGLSLVAFTACALHVRTRFKSVPA